MNIIRIIGIPFRAVVLTLALVPYGILFLGALILFPDSLLDTVQDFIRVCRWVIHP